MIGKVIRVSLPFFGWIFVSLSLPTNFEGIFAGLISGAMALYVASREANL